MKKYTINDIIITATRVNKKVIDVPFPISIIGSEELKLKRKTAVNDALSNIPGVFMQSRYGNHDVRISIRGFGSRSNTGIRGVRILMDGIPESEPDGQTRIEAVDLNAVGNIELIRGNSSSMYTNAPGGVINFKNSFFYPNSFIAQFNEFGSYGMRRNGIQLGLKGNNFNMLTTYTYHNFSGFREHSSDYWHVLNTVIQTYPTQKSNLEILGYLVNGIIRLPGSLTKEEFLATPFQTAQREKEYDYRRVTKKGRVGLRFNTILDDQNEFEVLGYGTIKYFERTQKDFRIMNRYGLGGSVNYIKRIIFLESLNTLSFGGDFFYQTGPVENYINVSGTKSDILQELTDETISNTGFYISMNSEISDNLSTLITARYDNILFNIKDNLNSSLNSERLYSGFTPKFALNYKLNTLLAIYGSYGLGFDSPAGNELDDYPRPGNPLYQVRVLNPDLNAQKSINSELGVKGVLYHNSSGLVKNAGIDLAFFDLNIKNEIVPFEIDGNVYYRNSARTSRRGIEFGLSVEFKYGFDWTTSYTYNNFKYTDYSALSYFINDGEVSSTTRDFSGNKVPSVPEHLFNTELLYKYSLTDQAKIFLRPNFMFVGSMQTNDSNDEKTEKYSLINFTAGVDLNLGHFDILVSGSVNNITDELYVGFININSTSRRYYEAGQPRSFYFSAKINYLL